MNSSRIRYSSGLQRTFPFPDESPLCNNIFFNLKNPQEGLVAWEKYTFCISFSQPEYYASS
jgi:hypothetical protein